MLRRSLLVPLLGLLFASVVHGQEKGAAKVTSPLQFQVADIDGKKVDLGRYKGKVVLIVNVASECGYTDQYKGLQALHEKLARKGLAILAFPSNDFGGQEPGTEAEIKEFARKKYGVQFDLFGKVRIQGKDAHPLYRYMTAKETNPKCAGDVSWNFEKFLIGRDGRLVARFAADVEPESGELLDLLASELNKK